jgi:hypothetical protein
VTAACRARFAASLALAAGVLAPAAGAAPGATELERCVAIAAPDARLACYDAMAGRRDPASPAASATGSTAPAPNRAPPVAAAAAAGDPAVADPATFGLSEARRRAPEARTDSIQAKVLTLSGDRSGQTLVRLDNGQTWVLSETDVRLAVAEQVTIRRAALGSYLLVTDKRHSYRARRTQ